jgi:hypothetical protein
MKNTIYKINKRTAALILTVLFLAASCSEYLDREPESLISDEDAFQNFRNFQGFTEQMYNLLPDIANHYWVASFNWGEDEVITLGNGEYLMNFHIDRGNYRIVLGKSDCFIDRSWSVGGDRFSKSIWGGSWYGIRLANMGLEALEQGKMVNATAEERNIIKGQMLFFRGFFHFQLIQYWGGMPYIDYVLPSDEKLTLPRMTYRECADKIAADLREAADLLPINWDNTTAGRNTAGQNALRANKIWALGFLGKNLLWAGSPLMANGTGGPRTYDAELCKQAASAFGELLSLVESGQTQYSLVDFADYSTLFYTVNQSGLMAGGTEAIMRSSAFGNMNSYWRQSESYQCQDMSGGDGICLAPAANYVNYYGMANGLPLTDPASGFDPAHPWKDRDPRFYHDIVYDGLKVVQGTMPAEVEIWRFAQLYTGGQYVADPRRSSRTGYLNYKFIPLRANRWEINQGYSAALHIHLSWMRLADVYLMYAEAAAQGYQSAKGKSSNYNGTAEDALNVIRDRAGVGHVNDKYLSSLDAFMNEVRRDRAVELAFESHRFNDLRRWLLLTEYPYNIKTKQEFNRVGVYDPEGDPTQNTVANWREEVIVNRDLSSKHYWFPLRTDDVSLYPDFGQNPGW